MTHYPQARLIGATVPMLASGDTLWVGYRFFSENAYEWARRSAGNATRVVALYFADTGSIVQTICRPALLSSRLPNLIRLTLVGATMISFASYCEGLNSPTKHRVSTNSRRSSSDIPMRLLLL